MMAIAATLALSGGCQRSDAPEEAIATVTGTVTYLQRIALPPDAEVQVTLDDVSLQDAPSEKIAEQIIAEPGQVPIPFELTYDPKSIVPTHTYAVQARISQGDQLLFINTTAIHVITRGYPTRVEIVVQPVVQGRRINQQ
jgi:putative lipoprotein